MPENDSLSALHAAVSCYLSTLETAAKALAEACPPIGRPYGQRLSRLRARLAFNSGAEQIEESCAVTARELQDYAEKASGYVEQQRLELRRGMAGLEEIVRTLAQRQEFYGERMRRFARQIENAALMELAQNGERREAVPDPAGGARRTLCASVENPAEAIGLPVGGLLSCVESMSHESQSLLKKMRDEMAQVETRLAEAEITDPVTGLLNRREMERWIAEVRARRETPVLVLFDFRESLPDEVARQVGARLGSQFRHHDVIARWSERQFLVLFKGRPETARARGEQIVPWIAGRYQLGGGAEMEASVEVRVVSEAPVADQVHLAEAKSTAAR